MAKLVVVTRDGSEHEIEGENGLSVMEIIRDAGFDELQALCGGCLSCATCHVHVETGGERLDPAGEEEHELLDTSAYRDARSRLSCQIAFAGHLDGLRVIIAAED
ncbi:2Fe-2S iron-sulfur cluster-binding protein [Sphingopyxis sp.]|uniref:2Fe-2S iron-sulfur cluster-binding protein n=1 Tax=Sphingopyxis sp. TaxID=1908224 RepID=UPI002B467793|nr:2Fe-2S iron-sulfur cluster-binding protein [Sphingopyxis sp.]HJS10536.1 2Fe-2S iron-sulfur cluster-binding protein [Sphingopyxis sp.]